MRTIFLFCSNRSIQSMSHNKNLLLGTMEYVTITKKKNGKKEGKEEKHTEREPKMRRNFAEDKTNNSHYLLISINKICIMCVRVCVCVCLVTQLPHNVCLNLIFGAGVHSIQWLNPLNVMIEKFQRMKQANCLTVSTGNSCVVDGVD